MITVGIIGSGGYVGGELIRCLVNHPEVKIDFCFSKSQAGKKIGETHEDLSIYEDLSFSEEINPDVDLIFLCLGHGNSRVFLVETKFSSKTKIIDLSNDFRLNAEAVFKNESFAYGLNALNKSLIKKANYVANPGCFATAIQLGLLPLAANGLLTEEIHINAITGSTGAGQGLSPTSHFSWRNNNVSIYKAFKHQHLDEIKESLTQLQPSFDKTLNFLPVRGNFSRGIFATIYTKSNLTEVELIKLFRTFYKDAPFTFISEKSVHLKQVINTNNCFIQVQKIDDKVLITSVLDNLLLGAAGQAIQNMNLMFGLNETTGLTFKANYF
ncbi:MAG: N-acetyl-gamma-glutamyl-phosphate reductase [Crocinitomix sp.]|jgi:N-acetyl-gamma-glutamyl-phosphate reductase